MSVKALCLISLSCILYQGERENIIPWNNVLKKEKKEILLARMEFEIYRIVLERQKSLPDAVTLHH